jgi:predicted RNA-binding protein
MCQVKVSLISEEGDSETLGEVAHLKVTPERIVVESLFESARELVGFQVREIDCLRSTVVLQHSSVKAPGAKVMNTQDVIGKVTVLLPHWLEHNEAHIVEMRQWQLQMQLQRQQQDTAEAMRLFEVAIGHMAEISAALLQMQAALASRNDRADA